MKRLTIIFILITIIIIILTYILYNIYIRKDTRSISNENSNSKEKIISTDLRIGITNFDTINPIISNNINVQNLSRLIFEPLLNLSYDYKLEECLVKEWNKIDKNIYLIRLRENVKWQDGKKFDSNDVIFTINMIKELKEKSIYYYNVENIKEVKKIDEYTIKIITENEIPYFEYNLIFPIMSSKNYTEEDFIKDNKAITPIGTGKYYIEEINKGNMVLKKNSYWWQGKELKINNISIVFYQNINKEITDIEKNKLDLINTTALGINEYLDKTKCNTKKYIGRNYDYIVINCKKNILNNKKIRQAINYGINKNVIIEKIYNNNYIKSEFPLDYGNYLYKNSTETLNYNINKAKEILKETKIKNIYLKLLVNENSEDKIKVATLIKNQLNEIGIKIKIIEKNKREYEEDVKIKNYDLALISDTYGFSPSLNSYFEEDNLSNYDNIKIKKLLKEIENKSEEDVKKIIESIKDYYNKDVPYISLYYDINTIIYSKNLRGEMSPNSYNIFYNIEDWYREYDK